MDNFELHEKAKVLSDTHTPYQLARMLVEAVRLLDYSDRYSDTDLDYISSPFAKDVRMFLGKHLKTVHPDSDFAEFK
ncbi:hypothetical protein VP14_143 [Vibrio phage VPMCC14]|nr:hypothetical protein VP14_143 [Vibrio phage VPMCC14]